MDHNLLWYDKKRYMGMPISFTRFSLSSDRLFLSTGCLTIRDEEILLYRIKDLNTKRTLWQRLFGVGTITVSSSTRLIIPLAPILGQELQVVGVVK